jgi:hypothetical protein
MHRISRRMVAVVVLIGAIAAGGAAFTASNTIPATTAGYGSSTISGATADSLDYTYSADGTSITQEDLVLHGDLTADVVKAGFNGGSLTACTVASAVDGSGNTPVTCTISQGTAGATAFNVLVSSN